MAAPHIHDLAAIIEDLERMGRLTRVTSEVDPAYDLAGLAYRMEGGPRAVLFEKVKGHDWPVFTGLYWNREMLADVLRQDAASLSQYVSGRIGEWQRRPVEPVVVETGPVLEVTEREVDLHSIPVPIHAECDGGPYFDAPIVIAKDPETGVRNASIQRFQVIDAKTLHVNIDSGRHLELYLEKARKLGRSLTFTLSCGVGPGLHFAASAPAEAAPPDTDELGIASAFHGVPVELVRGSNGHDEMVAHAMWALECEMVPGELAEEGPFAEVTGYYARVEPRPVVHVKKIHRRANPIFQTILSGMEVWNSVGLLGEANVLSLLQRQVPGVEDVYFTHGGSGFYHAVVQMTQKRAGWSKQAIMAAFAAFPPLKMVTVVDEDVDIHDAADVEWAMATRMNPRTGITVLDDAFGHGLNPSFPDYIGPKVGFDATKPFPPTFEFERVTYKPMALEAVQMVQQEIRPPLAAGAGTGGRKAREAAEAHLARPAPITPEDLMPRVAGRPAAAAGDDGDDADAWLARPQPVDMAALAGAPSRSASEDEDRFARPAPITAADLSGAPGPAAVSASGAGEEPDDTDTDDPDAWLARPQPAVLTVPGAAGASARVGEADEEGAADDDDEADGDAWLARPQPIDPASLAASGVSARARDDDDPDAWLVRPQPARFEIPEVRPLVDEETLAARRGAARNAAAGKWKGDPDAELTRPQAASFEVPRAKAPAPTGATAEDAPETVVPETVVPETVVPETVAQEGPPGTETPEPRSSTTGPSKAGTSKAGSPLARASRGAKARAGKARGKSEAKSEQAKATKAADTADTAPTPDARSESRGGSAGFFETTTASAPRQRRTGGQGVPSGNGRSKPGSAADRTTREPQPKSGGGVHEDGGFF